MNKSAEIFVSALMLYAFLSVSCRSESLDAEDVFKVEYTDISFRPEGGEKVMDFTSSVVWSIKITEEWLTVSPISGTTGASLTFVVEKNDSPDIRTAEILITGDHGHKLSIRILQDGNVTIPKVGKTVQYRSSQSAELSATIFSAGDTVLLMDGSWNDMNLTFQGKGTEQHPVVFISETPGGVLLSGSSTLVIDGAYVEVSGLLFYGPTSMSRNHVVMFAPTSSYCRFTNSAIQGYNPIDSSEWESRNTKYLSLYGTRNRVDHCYFENKANLGSLMAVFLQSGIAANHQIDHNHFYKRNSLLNSSGGSLNAQDIITIGNSSTSSIDASCIVEYNLFEECNGEVEIISNKSCGNVYRNNVFYKNAGTLTLRHGHGCSVYGNLFLGERIKNSGGVRIIGENHTVYNNYFQDLTGSGYYTAICITNGDDDGNEAGYEQVVNAQIFFNTFYNCDYVFNVGFRPSPLAPIRSVIGHNVIFSSDYRQNGVTVAHPDCEIEWKNNIMNQGRFSNFSPINEQFLREEINYSFYSSHSIYGIYRPSEKSFLASHCKTKDFAQVDKDIFDVPRGEERTIGAFEISDKINILIPTSKNTGCTFIHKKQ